MYEHLMEFGKGSRRLAQYHRAPATLTLTQTLSKWSVVEQDVTGANSLGYNALGQDVGHPWKATAPRRGRAFN